MPYQVVVIETSDVVPRLNPEKPCLYVGIHRSDHIAAGMPEHLRAWVAEADPKPRPDLTPDTEFHRKTNATERLRKVATRLRRQGYTVNRSRASWNLYVIELRPDARTRDDRPAVYVGQTSKPIEVRIKEHMKGGVENNASRVVTRRGVRLLYRLIPRQKYYSRQDAEAAETRLGLRLEARGYRVYGPQGMNR